MSVRSRSNWNLEVLVFGEREKPEYLERNFSEQEREPTTNSTHMASTLGFELGPHWREAIALTTAPPLLLDKYFFSLTSIITNAGATNA